MNEWMKKSNSSSSRRNSNQKCMQWEYSKIVCVCVWWDKKLANVRNERYLSFSLSLPFFSLSLSLAFSLEVYWSVRLFVFVFSRFSSPPLALCLMCVHTIPFRLFFWTIRYSRPNNTVFVCECEYVSLCGMRIFTFYYSSLYSIEEECMAQCSNKYHSTQRYIYIQYWMAYSFFAVQLSINP